ncbi:hypothetical protein PC113_g1929 [Phytophthora cactorum]|uniref:Uncharacterized protein n=1 Tax=Phytophthora cactorum TaxID=29920 RepID=A0A8T0ZYV6_9STRA|nr:hypothetical protein PC113_g1929 [Phytophthora cactorum]
MNDIIKVVGTTGSSAAYKGYMGQDQFLTSTNTIGGLTPAGFIKFFHDLLQSKSSDVQRELTVPRTYQSSDSGTEVGCAQQVSRKTP